MKSSKRISIGAIVFVFAQSIAISGIYLYSQIVKNSIVTDARFLFTIFHVIFVLSLLILSTIISLIYFIDQFIDTRKIYTILPILINIFAFVIGKNCFITSSENNFDKYKDQRNEIVELILEGEFEADETGKIMLPTQLQDDDMARNGYVRLISYSPKVGIYFCTYSGLLETSSGYIYFTEVLKDPPVTTDEIVIHDDLGEGWYSCSTD